MTLCHVGDGILVCLAQDLDDLFIAVSRLLDVPLAIEKVISQAILDRKNRDRSALELATYRIPGGADQSCEAGPATRVLHHVRFVL